MTPEDKSEVRGMLAEFAENFRDAWAYGRPVVKALDILAMNYKCSLAPDPPVEPEPPWGPGDTVEVPNSIKGTILGVYGKKVWVEMSSGAWIYHCTDIKRTAIALIKKGDWVWFCGEPCGVVSDGLTLRTPRGNTLKARRHELTLIRPPEDKP